MNNFALRSVTGAGFVVVMIGSALLGQVVFSLLMFIVSLFGLLEYNGLWQGKSPFRLNQYLAVIVGMLVYTSLALNAAGVLPASFLLLNIPLFFILFIAELWRAKEQPFVNIGLSLAGIIYIPFSLGLSIYFFDPINSSGPMHYGTMIGFLFILWLNDTGAYLFGSWLGRNKLFPRISPGKSWEGSIGGGGGSFINSLWFFFPVSNLSCMEMAGYGIDHSGHWYIRRSGRVYDEAKPWCKGFRKSLTRPWRHT